MSPWVGVSLSAHALWLLPLAAIMACAMAFGGATRDALRWTMLLAASMALTLATKLAFIGWGIGVAALDFAGTSGHAANAAAIYPVLAALLWQHAPRAQRHVAMTLAVVWSVLVAISRLKLNQHTPSEVVIGLVQGWLVAIVFLRGVRWPLALSWRQPGWLAAGYFSLMLAGSFVSLPLRLYYPHYLVVDVALAMSGNARPYSRELAWPRRDPENGVPVR
ncbi:phosphatase PAP2 family protein [Chitinolyticbacter albus]|uniref:phosphatase PAP2 family protein n=1 Tax=Chitinolyticbacter albus TaxID=2961951 RepID=UPI00210A3E05|nr:phosphatase PAP2 family protein [Chitinolyticbacter albus]